MPGGLRCARKQEICSEEAIMTDKLIHRGLGHGFSRRSLLQTGAGLVGGAMLPALPAFAEDKPAIGSKPTNNTGSTGGGGGAGPRAGAGAGRGGGGRGGGRRASGHGN